MVMETIKTLRYHLCPKCQRAVPAALQESYCPNDGTPMLTSCPHCKAAITSPYSRFCTACGSSLFAGLGESWTHLSKDEKERGKS
jgi:RNA polymerase subunit RPABC4/transcription elongation factor Spt4